MITPLAKLQESFLKNLSDKEPDAILISSISNIIYLTDYSGFSKEEREAYLFVTKNKQYILTDGRYTQAVRTLIPNYKLIEITSENSIKKALKDLKTKHKIKKLGIEENDLKVNEYKALKKHYNNTYYYGNINSLRSIKNENEVSKIEKACKLGDKTFNYILKKIKVGVSEKEIAREIEFFIKRAGADISFSPIVAFGKNSALPHHVSTHNKLTKNQIVLLDFGVKLDNYCSDMTRTVFFGKPTNEQKKMYQAVLEAQQKTIDYISNHYNNAYYYNNNEKKVRALKAKDADRVARLHIKSKGYLAIPHSLGHGIGIDVHELPHISPNSKDILKEGMVFSIEPGIYIPNFGGVRIEDLIVLTKSGPRLLTHSPKTLIAL